MELWRDDYQGKILAKDACAYFSETMSHLVLLRDVVCVFDYPWIVIKRTIGSRPQTYEQLKSFTSGKMDVNFSWKKGAVIILGEKRATERKTDKTKKVNTSLS